MLFAFFLSKIEKMPSKNLFRKSSFFFAGTVATTIGFGTLVPVTPLGKVFCIPFMGFGIPYFVYMTSLLSKWINKEMLNNFSDNRKA